MSVSITKNWNTDENYWTLNPIMKTIQLFRNLHNNDKSKGKAQSSKLMWAIALYADPNEENPWRNTAFDERKTLISVDYLNDKDFNWDHPEIIAYCDAYETFCLTVAERELIELEKKIIQRSRFISGTDYTLDYYEQSDAGKNVLKKGTASQLDTMLLNTGKIFDQLETIKGKLEKEKAEGHLRGGAAESLSESGAI